MISVLVQITIISLLHQVRRFCHPLPCPIKLFKIPIIPSIIITFPTSTTIFNVLLILLILLMVIIGGQLSLSRCRSCWQVAPHLSQNPIASILHCSRSKCVRDNQIDRYKHKHKVISISPTLCCSKSRCSKSSSLQNGDKRLANRHQSLKIFKIRPDCWFVNLLFHSVLRDADVSGLSEKKWQINMCVLAPPALKSARAVMKISKNGKGSQEKRSI